MEDQISLRKPLAVNMANKICVTIIQIIITGILSRILSPYDYGIVAVTSIFTNFFVLISGMGISPAIVQNKELCGDDYDNIFTFTLYFGIFLAVLFSFLGYGLVYIYGNPCYSRIGYLLGLSLFFNTLNMVPNGILLKRKDFSSIAVRTVSVNLVCGVVSIWMAAEGFGYYTLVFNSVLNAAGVFFWNIFKVKTKFRKKIRIGAVRKILFFAKFQMAFDTVNYFSSNLDNILISLVLGSTVLSFYDKGYKLMMYPVTLIGTVVSPVLQPVFSEFQNEKCRIYERYMPVLKLLLLCGAFFSAEFVACSGELVEIFYGPQWGETVPVFLVLGISTFYRLGVTTFGYVLQSINKVNLLFKLAIVITAQYAVWVALGVMSRNLTIVAVTVVAAYFVQVMISYIGLDIGFGYKWYTTFFKMKGMFVFHFIMLLYAGTLHVMLSIQSTILSLLVKGMLVLFPFLVYILTTKKINLVKEALR